MSAVHACGRTWFVYSRATRWDLGSTFQKRASNFDSRLDPRFQLVHWIMGKIVNKRRVARLRHSAHPFAQDQARPVIASGGDDDASVLALSHDALESIQTQLKHELPRERMSGTAMIVQHITEETMDQSDSGDKIKDIIDSLCPLLLDRAENVRFGAFDAFWYVLKSFVLSG